MGDFYDELHMDFFNSFFSYIGDILRKYRRAFLGSNQQRKYSGKFMHKPFGNFLPVERNYERWGKIGTFKSICKDSIPCFVPDFQRY